MNNAVNTKKRNSSNISNIPFDNFQVRMFGQIIPEPLQVKRYDSVAPCEQLWDKDMPLITACASDKYFHSSIPLEGGHHFSLEASCFS